MTARPPLFDVVLHQPEIPNNTGNIGRTCVATACRLRLIHPLGFDIDEKACRRAGLDYWPRLDLLEHPSWDAYRESLARDTRHPGNSPPTLWLFTTKARRLLYDAPIRRGDHLVFGKETAGLPDEILAGVPPERRVCLPMAPGERSLNLATVVCAAVFEGIRQLLGRGELSVSDAARLDLGAAD